MTKNTRFHLIYICKYIHKIHKVPFRFGKRISISGSQQRRAH